jgi:hypothetical protein
MSDLPIDVAGVVQRDTVACFKEVFPDGPGFALSELFASTEGEVTNQHLSALGWTWGGRDTVGFNGLAPTGREIVVHGVTIVEVREGDDPLYHRFIDWTHVAGQLGLGFIGRTSTPEYREYDHS